jgi:hypothetical protein
VKDLTLQPFREPMEEIDPDAGGNRRERKESAAAAGWCKIGAFHTLF